MLLLAFAIGGLRIEKKAKVFHCWCRPRLYREPWTWKKNKLARPCVRSVRPMAVGGWSQQCVNPISFYDFISAIFPLFLLSSIRCLCPPCHGKITIHPIFPQPPTPHSRARRYSLSFAWTRKSCIVTQLLIAVVVRSLSFLRYLRLPHRIKPQALVFLILLLSFPFCIVQETILCRFGGGWQPRRET